MGQFDWLKERRVIILRESSKDNLIICYYDFEKLLFFAKIDGRKSQDGQSRPMSP